MWTCEPSGGHTTESTTPKGTSQGSGTTVETASTSATTGFSSISPIVSTGGITPGSNGDCRDSPAIDCRMYNFNVTCQVDGIYHPWAEANCPLYCGYCQVPTVSVECKDKLTTCDEYQADLCTNHLFLVFIETNCRKFCGICKGVDYLPMNFG